MPVIADHHTNHRHFYNLCDCFPNMVESHYFSTRKQLINFKQLVLHFSKLLVRIIMSLILYSSGRKWNVEKNQVDIVPYKADRLFLGTLCFTILLFLLPTTAAYYVVFTALRLMVLFVKGIVGRVIDMMHNLPVFPLIIAFVRSDLMPGTLYIQIVILSFSQVFFAISFHYFVLQGTFGLQG